MEADSGTESATSHGVPLRVMTYNIKGHGALLHRRHVQEIGRVIRDVNPDIAGLQEVHRGTWQARRHDQIAELEDACGMRVTFGRSMGHGDRAFGNALLTRGAIEEQHVEPLPGKGEPRTLFVSTIAIDGVKLHAYVTHLAAWARFGAKERLAQAEAVARIAEQSALPFVLMGDFNSSPTSAELRVFHDGKLVTSCFPSTVVTHRATRQCLDYVFVDPSWEIRDARVLERGPSDHWPLIAELERRLPAGRSAGTLPAHAS